jgi:hypothetical protein
MTLLYSLYQVGGQMVQRAASAEHPLPVTPMAAGGVPMVQGLTREQLDSAPVAVSTQLLGGTIPAHDNVLMTYTGANLTTVQYRQNLAVVATVTLTYDALGNMLSATRS